MTRARWTVCWFLFFATTLSYLDRAVLAVLKPLLERQLHWSQIDYGWMVTVFQLTYALSYACAGRLIDVVGVRWGLLSSVALWSLATIEHAVARTVMGFNIARASLGLGEGGMFPAAIRAVAEWYPKEERALATGLFNSGSNFGAVASPLIVAWLASLWGWQAAFLVSGAVGFLWVAGWVFWYRAPDQNPRVSTAELAYIRRDPPAPGTNIPWLVLLRHPQTWAFAVGMTASAPIWWFYIFWAPDFLNKRYNLGLTQSSLPLMITFLAASIGGIGAGWMSSRLLQRGWSVNAARKTALLVCVLCVAPVVATPLVSNPWLAMTLVGLAAAAHCGFAANLFTLASDTVPQQAVSSVVGIGGMAGALGGMAFAQLVSRILYYTNNSYVVPFTLAPLSYAAALVIMHLLLPRMEPMRLDLPAPVPTARRSSGNVPH